MCDSPLYPVPCAESNNGHLTSPRMGTEPPLGAFGFRKATATTKPGEGGVWCVCALLVGGLHNTKWTTSFFLFPDPWAARGGVLVYRLFWTCGCCVRVLVWFVCLISRSVRALSCPAVCRRGSHFGWLLDFASVCHSSLLLSHGDPVKGSRMRPAPWLLTSL